MHSYKICSGFFFARLGDLVWFGMQLMFFWDMLEKFYPLAYKWGMITKEHHARDKLTNFWCGRKCHIHVLHMQTPLLLDSDEPDDFSVAWLWPLLFNQGKAEGNTAILLSQAGCCLCCRCLLQGHSTQGCHAQVLVSLGQTRWNTGCIIHHTDTWLLGSVPRPPYGFHLLYQSAGETQPLISLL